MENQAKKRILCAEDEENVYTLISRVLKNYETVNAATYEDAIKLSDENFDLYITDGAYPSKGGDSGLEFCKYLKNKHNGNAKIIFASSLLIKPEFREQVKSIDDKIVLLLKPFNIADLKKSVEDLLNTQ
jgi:CheY-like chemotaxis protein